MSWPNSGADIISFSRHPWRREAWKNRHQIISRLTNWHRVLYVEAPVYIRHLLQSGPSSVGSEMSTENLIRYRPPKYLPQNYGYPRVERAFQRLRILHLQAVCRRMNVHKPVLLIWDPEFSYMLEHFNESLTCYFVDDQYSLFSGTNATEAARQEAELLKRVDLVLCTSQTLCKDKERFHNNVHLIPNGVDYELFAPAATNQYAVCPELQKVPRPILGFVGNLDDRVNYELLFAVANDSPEWYIVLIGPDNIYTASYRQDFDRLLNCKNVKWLGFRSINEIPVYIQSFDVCAIVNRQNDFSQFVYPIKLHEYLAAGKPIISTGIPSVLPFESLVHIADSADEWRKCLSRALAETGKEWIERRQNVARQHTWGHRAEQVHVLLDAALNASMETVDAVPS